MGRVDFRGGVRCRVRGKGGVRFRGRVSYTNSVLRQCRKKKY